MKAVLLVAAALTGLSCASEVRDDSEPAEVPRAQAPATNNRAFTDFEWELTSVGERTNPRGAGGRAPTIAFEPAKENAHGFAGCNSYGSQYRMVGDSLTFGDIIRTEMLCSEGMELEVAVIAALEEVTTYAATESTLTFERDRLPIAIWRRSP